MPKINTSALTEFAKNSWNEFKSSFQATEIDLDVKTTPAGHLKVVANNVGFSAKVPGGKAVAEALVFAVHSGGIGELEGNEPPEPTTPA